jgi:branched-chain amino acid transport system ATP-binding protein
MLLSVENVGARYGRSINALQGTSLEVAEGEIVGVIGHNGAGKSTLLKVLAGLMRPTSGRIVYDDKPLPSTAAQTVKRGIALVPEGRWIFASLSVGENLRLGAAGRRDRRGLDEDIERELKRFPVLGRYWSRGASLLSGGEQQQLAISRALLSRPRLLLLDEPTLGLAPLLVAEIFRLTVELRDEGMTVVLVEQNAQQTVKTADRTYVMAPPGRIIGSGTAVELADSSEVTEYLGFELTGRPS